jgi:hypothetical protein
VDKGAWPGRRSSLTSGRVSPSILRGMSRALNSSRSVVKPEAVGSSSGWLRACDRSLAQPAEAPMRGCCADAARRSHQSNLTWSCGELERSLSGLARRRPQASRLSCDRRCRLSRLATGDLMLPTPTRGQHYSKGEGRVPSSDQLSLIPIDAPRHAQIEPCVAIAASDMQRSGSLPEMAH